MTLGDLVKEYREKRNISMEEFSKMSNLSKGYISMLENNINPRNDKPIAPTLPTIKKIALAMNMDIDSILKVLNSDQEINLEAEVKKSTHGVAINILGRVAAGIPIDAVEEIIDTEEITEELARTGTFFGLKIKGDSMTPNICDGDIVIVRQQDDAESGDIVIATINGDEATCKRIRKYKQGIELISNNPSYEPFEFSNEEILSKPVKIIGKVVELRRKF